MALNLQSLRKALIDVRISYVGRTLPHKGISTSAPVLGKRNFRKFHLGNKRGTKIFRRDRNAGLFPDIPIETEVRPNGFKYGERFHLVSELVPQFVVPDLTDFTLKPYVSYRCEDVYQEEFKAENLFEVVYQNKIEEDFKNGKLDENGNPTEPSENEILSAEEAWINARKSGSDIFSERIPKPWECLEIDVREYKRKKYEQRGLADFSDVLKEPLTQ